MYFGVAAAAPSVAAFCARVVPAPTAVSGGRPLGCQGTLSRGARGQGVRSLQGSSCGCAARQAESVRRYAALAQPPPGPPALIQYIPTAGPSFHISQLGREALLAR